MAYQEAIKDIPPEKIAYVDESGIDTYLYREYGYAPQGQQVFGQIRGRKTSYKKGHKYMTVVINHDKSSVIWCAPGYGKEVLSQFFELLSEEQRASIRCVSADGARWIASCVEEYCPNALRCIDPFHVVSWATDALDQVRREAWAEAHQQAKNQPKRKPGRPAKGETAPKKKQAKSVKNLCYASAGMV